MQLIVILKINVVIMLYECYCIRKFTSKRSRDRKCPQDDVFSCMVGLACIMYSTSQVADCCGKV